MIVLDPPRWQGGPPICVKENLPAHVSEKAMNAFHEANGPSCKVKKTWLCPFCNHWHMESTAGKSAR